MNKLFILILFSLTMNTRAFADSPQAAEMNESEVIDVTLVGQDAGNLYVQAGSGEGLVLPVNNVNHRGYGFQRIPGTNCFSATNIVYTYCIGGSGIKYPDPYCSDPRQFCPFERGFRVFKRASDRQDSRPALVQEVSMKTKSRGVFGPACVRKYGIPPTVFSPETEQMANDWVAGLDAECRAQWDSSKR